MTKIYTGNLSLLRNDKRLMDITVKTGIRTFAPTWSMVNDYKYYKCDELEYVKRYIALMEQNSKRDRHTWRQLANNREIILACYCSQNIKFCHRYLLAEILAHMDDRFKIMGEITTGGTKQIPRWIERLNLW